MSTILVAILSAVGFVVAYNTYGRYLARKVFGLDPKALVPAQELEDGVDFVPTKRSVVFGHHFTSIAGTGPIVGPAIAVFWGWLPALLWVLIGSIFIGAVHDFGALVLSLRSRGQTIGDIAGRMISHRARVLFLFILFFALSIVLGIFGLVIATIFSLYPETVLSVWTAMPLAVLVGFWIYRKGGNLLFPSLAALIILYAMVYIGVHYLPLSLPTPESTSGIAGIFSSPVVIWTGILFVYCYIASVLPVWVLLQPRDYINSHQLVVALILLTVGLFIAHPEFAAPAFNANPPADAPPIFPFLFITIACGAVSGFHCLVSSGTTSKQLKTETDAQYIGYGAMLLEGALAVLVILACCAGLGMGVTTDSGEKLVGEAAWQHFYGQSWTGMSLGMKVGAFIEGGANMVASVGIISLPLAVGIVAVMVACFAATTLDTATRLQRYVIQELGAAIGLPALKNKYTATTVAVGVGLAVALTPGPGGPGTGGMLLWPLFGAVNQLLAGLAFLVIAFYLVRHNKPYWFLVLPCALMILLPAWAMWLQIFGWVNTGDWHLVLIGLAIEGLQLWMIVEAAIMWRGARGVLPQALPPLRPAPAGAAPMDDGGRSC